MVAMAAFPADGMELTHILVVAEIDRARSFYRDVLGAFGTWLLLVTGGGPTADEPTVAFVPPADPDRVSHSMTIRVPDCRAAHATLAARGASFLAEPVESEWEIRAFFRDPDGHLIEISEAKARS